MFIFGYYGNDGEKHLNSVDIRLCNQQLKLPNGLQAYPFEDFGGTRKGVHCRCEEVWAITAGDLD